MRPVTAIMLTASPALAAAIVATVLLRTPPAPEPPQPPAVSAVDPWGARSEAAIERAIALDDGTGRPFHYAWLASAIAHRHGWAAWRAQTYLDVVLDSRNGDGGWGIGEEWDVFQDGSTNPADTTYTVTLAGHVGPVLLEAHEAGVVSSDLLAEVVDLVLDTPRVPEVSPGVCVSYSHAPVDAKAGHCVHNVNLGVAAFLHDVEASGFGYRADDSRRLRADIVSYEAATHLPDLPGWRYSDTSGRANSAGHTGYQTESAMTVAPGLGALDLAHWISRDMGPDSWLGHIAMGRYACDRIGDWLDEYDAAIADQPFGRQVQAARYTALISEECR